MKTHHYLFGLVLALGLFAATLSPARAFVGISVGIAPPPLPVYVQPPCPGDGYVWTPGYWAWDPDADSYYWVPGAWALAPEFGLLWTPCWWGWQDGRYCFHRGYWGHDVGFYGGINYGYGYDGHGYHGGYWRGHHFVVNNNVNHFNGSRVSFNGGRGGTTAVATAAERRAGGERHFGATNAQNAQVRSAAADPAQRFSANHGNPRVTETSRAGSFRGANANAATGARHQRSLTGESAFTGESRTASNHVSQRHANNGNAFTGENRTASSQHASRTGRGESAFTGESRSASAVQHERTAQASAEHRSSQMAVAQHQASIHRAAEAQRTASVERARSESRVSQQRVSDSHFSAPSRTESFHPSVSHSSGGGGGFSHAAVPHSGGGGGFAHASIGGGGGGFHGGGGHPGGGGGGHGGGGGGHGGGGGGHH